MSRVTECPVLVTGAGGWVASHVIYQLLEKGYKVRGTVRNLKSDKYAFLKTLHPLCETHLELVEADCMNSANWDRTVDGVEYVIHLASPFTFNYKDENAELIQPAVNGVENLFTACFNKNKGILEAATKKQSNNSEEDAIAAKKGAAQEDDPLVKRIVLTSSVCSVTYGHSAERYKGTRALIQKAQAERVSMLQSPDSNGTEASTECGNSVEAPASKQTDKAPETAKRDLAFYQDDARTRASARVSLPTGETLGDFRLFNETDFSVREKIIGYELSKTVAELRAWEMIKDFDQELTVLEQENKHNLDKYRIELSVMCPGFVFGPIFAASQAYGESAAQIQRVILKTYPFIPDINSAHVDVRDVADCHIRGMEIKEAGGKRFLVASDDGNIDFIQQAALIAKHFKPYGFSPAQTAAPRWLLKVGALIIPSVRAVMNKLNAHCYVSNQKARDVLHFTQWRTTEEALRSHCLTLMKHRVIERRRTPQEVIDACVVY